MTTVVVSQPMFFPWPGLFDQIRVADIYVHYDDVQMPLGRSFVSRVQVKTVHGVRWMSVPVERHGMQQIRDVLVDDAQPWRSRHMKLLEHAYSRAPFRDAAVDLVQRVYGAGDRRLAELNRRAIEAVASEIGLDAEFVVASSMACEGSASERLVAIVRRLGGDTYVTGHGAKNYLNHMLFEQAGISVRYMDYAIKRYPQLHGDFIPFVSVLDLLSNVGVSAADHLGSSTVDWRSYLRRSAADAKTVDVRANETGD